MSSNIYRRGIWIDCEKNNYFRKVINFMSQTKNANVATFMSAIIGAFAAIVGAYIMAI